MTAICPVQRLHDHFKSVDLNIFPGSSNIVTPDSRFVKACAVTQANIGLAHSDALMGLGYDEMPCAAAEHADTFQKEDRRCHQQEHTFLSHQYYAGSWKLMLVHKKPIISQGELLGLFVNFNDMTHTGLVEITRFLKTTDPSSVAKSFSMELYDVRTIKHRLTTREHECLFYLCRGYTYREVGALLKISLSTVQTHFEHVKMKMKIYKKSALIEKAMQIGLHNIIPQSLLKKK